MKFTSHAHTSRIIAFLGIFVIALAITIGTLSLSYFRQAETAWKDHNDKATAISTAFTNLTKHIGYGGFIHNFKNLVLRKDLARYQPLIEQDIVGFKQAFDSLAKLLKLKEDQLALAEIRKVFEQYTNNYQLLLPLIAQQATMTEIDAVVKVDDTPALKAINHLNQRTKERAKATEAKAQQAFSSALKFAFIGGILVIISLLIGIMSILVFIRRLEAANEATLLTQHRLDILLDTAPDPMLTVGQAGKIVRANSMALEFFGYTQAELLNMTVEDLIPEKYRAAHPQQRAGYFNQPENRKMDSGFTLTALTRDGREPKVEISLSHSGEGADKLATLTLRDITEQEQNKVALIQAKHQAEQALVKQQIMQDELVQSEKLSALGGLVAGVAHEINTPIGVTLSAATHLESETHKIDKAYQAGELSAEELSEYFETAQQATKLMSVNIQRASDLVQGFKQVAVDQTGGEKRSFDLAIYIDELLTSLHPVLKKSQITIQVDCPPELILNTYPGALSQVLTNLIMNALLHGFEENQAGQITITVTDQGDWVLIRFGDNGKGIPKELQTRVFEPFFTTSRSKGGSGLGLHIIHSIITRTLRGTLSLDSLPNKGTTITFRFPKLVSLSAKDPFND